MNVQEQIGAIIDRIDDVMGRLAAMHCAIAALAGETDPELRSTLFDDLIQLTQDGWLGRPIEEHSMEIGTAALNTVAESFRRSFERPLLQPELRQPPPRRKAS